MTEQIGTCGHTPERIKAEMDAHDDEIREHIRQENAVLSRLDDIRNWESKFGFGHEATDELRKNIEAIIERARRAEGR